MGVVRPVGILPPGGEEGEASREATEPAKPPVHAQPPKPQMKDPLGLEQGRGPVSCRDILL